MVARRICVVTGTRAEYGLLRYLMQAIIDASELELQLLVTGMHLSPEFGLTYREIEADGFTIDRKVEMLLSSDTAVGIAKATGLGMIGLADAFAELQPDLLVVLGDRFEALAAVISAMYARIPIAHLHGGEITQAAFDEGIRHSITKMSHVHFVATQEYRDRVIQLGESPDRVHVVGGLGADAIARTKLLSRQQLEEQLGFRLGRQNLLVTFHPATLEDGAGERQFDQLLMALDTLDSGVHIIFTKPNADTGGRALIRMIDRYTAQHSERAIAFTSLGQKRYWSAMALADAVVGNSSSGLLEAPTFGVGTVNIGDRQRGRTMAETVVNCQPEKEAIAKALEYALSHEFELVRKRAINPYGTGGAAARIISILESLELTPDFIKKIFRDMPVTEGR